MPNVILSDGFEITIPIDYKSQKCMICDELVILPSVGGDIICPWCDVGSDRKKGKWNFLELMKKTGRNSKAAKRRVEIKESSREIQTAHMLYKTIRCIEQG